MAAATDEELIGQFRAAPQSEAGKGSINELFGRYHNRVALWCYRFTGDREGAADLAQEIFLRAYRNLDSFRGESRFSTWLYTVARNHCTNEWKAKAARPEVSAEPMTLDRASEEAGIEEELIRTASVEQMRKLMTESLDETELQVMTLHYGEELRLEAVTRLLGLTNQSGAKAYVVSARRKLAAAVAKWRARESRGAK